MRASIVSLLFCSLLSCWLNSPNASATLSMITNALTGGGGGYSNGYSHPTNYEVGAPKPTIGGGVSYGGSYGHYGGSPPNYQSSGPSYQSGGPSYQSGGQSYNYGSTGSYTNINPVNYLGKSGMVPASQQGDKYRSDVKYASDPIRQSLANNYVYDRNPESSAHQPTVNRFTHNYESGKIFGADDAQSSGTVSKDVAMVNLDENRYKSNADLPLKVDTFDSNTNYQQIVDAH